MFECRACVLRTIRAIASDGVQANAATRNRLPHPRRNAANYSSISTAGYSARIHDGLVAGKQPIEEDKHDAKKQKTLSSGIPASTLQIELKYLSDRVKLAEHVRYTLRSGLPEKALDLCRLASKQGDATVSWNHCVDWYIQMGKMDEAFRIYNEMKKRAQFPDAHTYMFLLRGLADKSDNRRFAKRTRERNVSDAVSIYNSMRSTTSRVKPNIKHANAALQVCSLAHNMDAMWGIINQLPTHGPGSADCVTYTTLLLAIRTSAFGPEPENMYLEQLAASRRKAIQDGRAVWRDIIARWRSGEVEIDERLVCAMAKVLMMSDKISDWDDVLNLVQQTMNIERLIPPVSHPDRRIEHVPQVKEGRTPGPEPEDSEGYRDSPSAKAFHPIKPHRRDSAHPNRPTTLAWVTPGNPTLSMIIGVCTLLRIPKTSVAYWDHLTSPLGDFQLKPDLPNFHSQLRLLSRNRSSGQAASLLERGMPHAGVTPTADTFSIAMGVCWRDAKNIHRVDNATRIVDLMDKTLPAPDLKTLGQFLTIVRYSDSGPQIIEALDRLDPWVQTVRSRIVPGCDDGGSNRASRETFEDKQQTIAVFQTIVGTIDNLCFRGLVPDEDIPHWQGRRKLFSSLIGRARDSLKQRHQELETQTDREPYNVEQGKHVERRNPVGNHVVSTVQEPATRAFLRGRYEAAEEYAKPSKELEGTDKDSVSRAEKVISRKAGPGKPPIRRGKHVAGRENAKQGKKGENADNDHDSRAQKIISRKAGPGKRVFHTSQQTAMERVSHIGQKIVTEDAIQKGENADADDRVRRVGGTKHLRIDRAKKRESVNDDNSRTTGSWGGKMTRPIVDEAGLGHSPLDLSER